MPWHGELLQSGQSGKATDPHPCRGRVHLAGVHACPAPSLPAVACLCPTPGERRTAESADADGGADGGAITESIPAVPNAKDQKRAVAKRIDQIPPLPSSVSDCWKDLT